MTGSTGGTGGGVPGVVLGGCLEGGIPGTRNEAQIPDISDLSIYMINIGSYGRIN